MRERHPDEPVGIVGKPFVLDKLAWKNPIVFGASIFSHPVDDPNLMTRLPVRKMLVPGEWVRQMCAPYYGDAVAVWPVGIDTDLWCPQPEVHKDVDVLVYDKIRWNKTELAATITDVAMSALERRGLKVHVIRYGHYEEEDFHRVLSRTRAMLFLCEHETQGIAYQQALSSGVPIYAWDRGGVWADPAYYPDKVSFAPVTSVPYWDDRCGLRFVGHQPVSRRVRPVLACRRTRRLQSACVYSRTPDARAMRATVPRAVQRRHLVMTRHCR